MPQTKDTYTLSEVEDEAQTAEEALMEAINQMYRALHKVEGMRERAQFSRASLRAQRVS